MEQERWIHPLSAILPLLSSVTWENVHNWASVVIITPSKNAPRWWSESWWATRFPLTPFIFPSYHPAPRYICSTRIALLEAVEVIPELELRSQVPNSSWEWHPILINGVDMSHKVSCGRNGLGSRTGMWCIPQPSIYSNRTLGIGHDGGDTS